MSTRSKADTLLPQSDPEAILKAGRKLAKIQKAEAKLNKLKNLPPIPHSTTMSDDPTTSSPEPKSTAAPNSNTTTEPSIQEYLKGVIHLQHQSIQQANADRRQKIIQELCQADADRILRLEETLLRMTIKAEADDKAARPAAGRINLQKLRSSDGPIYIGPFQGVEKFIMWIRSVQIFFATKGVTHDDDKIQIVGSLIRKTNTTVFYANGFEGFLSKPWSAFRKELITFALPPMWCTTLIAKYKYLSMTTSKSFLTYSTRSRTLQSMLNFDVEKEIISDFDLAESMTLGMPDNLQTDVHNHQILLQAPFVFSNFESRASGFWDGIVKQSPGRHKPNPPVAG
ncbi:hypothetical protein PGT21_011336 [Puccinia graminis f. sp. tritici]|uniref:Uncharacterized protein n=1 Tax=Puccinia graminis f. sp. tritici TaxID=56615 RepID=A0A5B0QF69_PUCGR|nr:hypothetical protein PGT21_011336 [Puccinia graminis f. sp. tritici]